MRRSRPPHQKKGGTEVPPSLGRKRPRKQQSKLMLLNGKLRHIRPDDKKNFALQHKSCVEKIISKFRRLWDIFLYSRRIRPVWNGVMQENQVPRPATQGLYGPCNRP
jgi:hypothetical protein